MNTTTTTTTRSRTWTTRNSAKARKEGARVAIKVAERFGDVDELYFVRDFYDNKGPMADLVDDAIVRLLSM